MDFERIAQQVVNCCGRSELVAGNLAVELRDCPAHGVDVARPPVYAAAAPQPPVQPQSCCVQSVILVGRNVIEGRTFCPVHQASDQLR